ncbi:hypothetical protein ACOSB0_00160, partial [Candidatus Phytoplasma citri]
TPLFRFWGLFGGLGFWGLSKRWGDWKREVDAMVELGEREKERERERERERETSLVGGLFLR